MFEHRDDEWEPIFGIDGLNATQNQSPPEYKTIGLSFTESYSGIGGHIPHMSSCAAIESPPACLNSFEASFPDCQDGYNEVQSYSISNSTNSFNSFGAVSAEPAGFKSGSDRITQPDRSYNVKLDQTELPQAPSPNTAISRYETYHASLPFDLETSSLHPDTRDALAGNRAGCTSDESVKAYFYSTEGHRQVQQQSDMYMNDCEGAPVGLLSSVPQVWQGGHQPEVNPASARTSPITSSGEASLLTSPPTISSTSAGKATSNDDSWKCDNCGAVLATKGLKNRNRNKRRHRCPGTGPKYPYSTCHKSFNRGDTRLRHQRKWHPEMHMQRKRKE